MVEPEIVGSESRKKVGEPDSVADLGFLSRIRLFSIPDSRYFFPTLIRIKEFKYFNP